MTPVQAWLRTTPNDHHTLQQLSAERGIEFELDPAHAHYGTVPATLPVSFYAPATAPATDPLTPRYTRHHITFALHDTQLITLHSDGSDALFDATAHTISQMTEQQRTPALMTYTLMRTLNAMNEHTVERVMRQLDDMNSEIHDAIAGQDPHGAPLGVSDMRELMTRMNTLQEVLAHTQESQFQLMRLSTQVHQHSLNHEPSITPNIERLEREMTGVKKYAGIALERMSAMQHSITAMLEVKQHEIVKVFTIITAVFLPPTLIATFYGMNFENMPALTTQHGFLITTVLTFIAAVIPLWYIKRKGWLR